MSNQEIETKVLDIDHSEIQDKLNKLGAAKTLDTKFTVDWYRPQGIGEGEDPWFLRVRSDSLGKHEVAWKAISDILGTARKHKEINFEVAEPEKIGDLFIELGLEKYAHQEKFRESYAYQNWKFDIDRYPDMPAFLEIEGESEEHVREAIKMLGLEDNKTWAEGERLLIQKVYGLDWYDMSFK